uniref:MULE transposase domain-containing protein n=1 Tax=Trichogramma kaykai TaxID=54128 RepID=A0ABD2VV94_9HYME
MKLNHTRVTHKGQLFTMFTCQANSSCPSQAVLNRYSEEDIFKVSMIDHQHPVSRSMDFCISKYIIYRTDGAQVHIHVSLWRHSSCKFYMTLNHTRVTHKGQLFTMFPCQANSSCPSQAVLNRYSEEDIFKVSMIDHQHPVSRSMDFCFLKYIIYRTDGAQVHIHVSLWRHSSCKFYMTLNHTRVTHKGQLFTMFPCQANSSCPSQAVLNRYSEEDIFKVLMIDHQHPVSRSMDFCISKYIIHRTYGAQVHIHVSLSRQLFPMIPCQSNSSCLSKAVLNHYSEEDIFKVSMIDHQHYLRCRNIQYGCHATARVYVNDPDVLIEVVPHDPSCIPSTDAIEIARFREALRTAAIRDHGEPREIYDAYALLYPEAAALLPFHAARASIRRWRLLSFPGSPNSIISMIHQLQDPANDRLFNHRTGFLTRHVMRDEDGYSHFVFYDLDVLNRVRMTVQTLLIDMTYKTCPLLPDANLQLGTVMAAYHNHSIPIIWFLLSRKTRNAYFKMSTVVRQLLVNSHIRAIVTDFELPLKTALREVFPEAYHVGCFFHFIRCLNGKLFRLGLRDYVVNNREANVFVRKCAALAFMPSDVILASFDLLLAETPARILASLQEFIDYFRSFWIRRVRPSNFSVWGVQARTNNAIESYHSVLLHRLGEHPVFWRWLCKIKQLVERQWSDFASMERGLSVARQPQNSTIFRNMVLQRAWRRYHLNDISSMELLTIGSNIIGEYFNSRFTNMRPFDVEEVMRLEERFDAALPQNDGYDPEFEHDIVGEFRPNERFRLNLRNVPAARPILMGEQNQGNGRRRRRRRRPNQGRAHQGPYQRRAAAPDDRDTAAIAVRSPRDERYHVAAVRIGHDMAVDVPRAQPPQLPDAALGEAAAIAVGIPRAPSPQYDAAAPNDDDAMAGALPRAPSPQYEAAAPNDDDAMAGALPRTQSPQLPDAALDGAAMLAVGSPISPIPWYEAAAPGEAASNFLGLPRSQSSRRLYNREELVDSDSDSDIDMTAAYHVNSTTNRASQPFHGRETAVAGPSRRFAPLPPASFASRSNRGKVYLEHLIVAISQSLSLSWSRTYYSVTAAPSISSSTNFRLPSTQSSPPINAREATQPRRFASLPHVNFESGSSEAASAPVADRTGNVSMPSQSCRGLVPAVIEPLPNPNRNRREPENQQHHDNRGNWKLLVTIMFLPFINLLLNFMYSLGFGFDCLKN